MAKTKPKEIKSPDEVDSSVVTPDVMEKASVESTVIERKQDVLETAPVVERKDEDLDPPVEPEEITQLYQDPSELNILHENLPINRPENQTSGTPWGYEYFEKHLVYQDGRPGVMRSSTWVGIDFPPHKFKPDDWVEMSGTPNVKFQIKTRAGWSMHGEPIYSIRSVSDAADLQFPIVMERHLKSTYRLSGFSR